MEIFGWAIIGLLALLGVTLIAVFTVPFVISQIKVVSYRVLKYTTDTKNDIDEKSKSRQKRLEILRERKSELKDKKLSIKLRKLDKKIKVVDDKIKLNEKLDEVINQPFSQVVENLEPIQSTTTVATLILEEPLEVDVNEVAETLENIEPAVEEVKETDIKEVKKEKKKPSVKKSVKKSVKEPIKK